MKRLTKSQRELLEELARRSNVHCIQYEPIGTLVKRGLAVRRLGFYYSITQDGLDAISGKGG